MAVGLRCAEHAVVRCACCGVLCMLLARQPQLPLPWPAHACPDAAAAQAGRPFPPLRCRAIYAAETQPQGGYVAPRRHSANSAAGANSNGSPAQSLPRSS